MGEFDDTRVMITGGASGIGRELAGALARAGAALVVVDRDERALDRAARELAETGVRVQSAAADVSDAPAVERLCNELLGERGAVDCLVNCAGIYPVTALMDTSPEEWDRVLSVNLRGPFLMTRAVARRMIAQAVPGRILNVSSTASQVARPGIAHYGASKAGLNQLTRVAAVELAPHRIRVNALLPGVIETERVLRSMASAGARAENEAKRARIPLGRFGSPGELVALAMFLLSEASSYCTGGLYTVDGGFGLGIPAYAGPRQL